MNNKINEYFQRLKYDEKNIFEINSVISIQNVNDWSISMNIFNFIIIWIKKYLNSLFNWLNEWLRKVKREIGIISHYSCKFLRKIFILILHY